MPAQNKTSLGLNQWEGNEYPKRIDFVEDNKIIDGELAKRVKYTDVATENKAGIITENRIKNIIPIATDTEAGILTLNKVREIVPQPDLSPYLRYDKTFIYKGDNINSGQDFVIRCNRSDIWTPRHLNMYSDDNPNTYQGTFHLNGGRAYYKVPNRNGGNWCEIMDNHDMAARDNRMNQMDADRNNVRNLAQDARNVAGDAWNKANDAQLNRVANMRLTSLISIPVWYGQTYERVGYVVTGFNNADGDIGGGDHMYMRCLQLQFGHGGWVTVWE